MGKIDLKLFPPASVVPNYSAGEILRKIRHNQELARIRQNDGLVTQGVVEAIQVEGGYGWAISDYIPFSFAYVSRPNFSWGLDGTAGIDWTNGGNTYSETLPKVLQNLTSDDYQPAIFVPRVIHWHIEKYVYFGCYLLVCQVNSECTETDKTVRIHYRFEGRGYVL